MIEKFTNKLVSAINASGSQDVDQELKQLQMEALRAQISASKAQESFYLRQNN